MNLVALHKALIYGLLVLPFGVLWLGGEMNVIVSVVFAVGLAASWFFEAPRVEVDRLAPLLVAATFGVLALTIGRLVSAGGLDIAPFVDLVLLLTVIKAMQRRRPGDYSQLLALSFLLMTAASAYNQGLLFAAAFAVYLIGGTLTLALAHLHEELTRYHPGELAHSRAEGAVLATVAGLALVVFAFSVVFFLAFPRMGFGLFNTRAREGLMTSGFADDVTLGEHGLVRDDDTVIMRVRLPGGPVADELRWRGTSFDWYDGTTWHRRVGGRDSALVADNGLYVHPREGLPRDEDRLVVQDIYLEPINSEVLFGLPRLVAIDFPEEDPELNRSFFREFVRVTRRGEFSLSRVSSTGVHYRAYSSPEPPAEPSALWPGGALDFRQRAREPHRESSAELEETYLALPDVLTPRFADLAQAIVARAETPYERALALETYLRTELTYTTNLPIVSRSNPLESFLFETRRGHCEYFATAMALLAREVGLPSRNVNGFLGGDWNRIGGFYAVRQSHAHSWVEVLLPGGAGWTTFDPTPASGLPLRSDSGFWASFSAFFDSLRMLWYRYVVDFDLEAQLGAVRAVAGIFGEGESLAVDLRSLAFATFRNLGVIALSLLIWVGQLLWLARRHRREAPWGRLDFSIGVGTVLLVELLVAALWRPEATLRAHLGAGLLPLLTFVAAWLGRRRPETDRARYEQPSRTKLRPASRIYLKVVQSLTRAGYDYRASDVPATLLRQAHERGAPYAIELAGVVGAYQRCRFGAAAERAELGALARRARTLRRAIRRAR